jgi:hypothetical protein
MGILRPPMGLLRPESGFALALFPPLKCHLEFWIICPGELKSGAHVDEWLKEMAGKLTQSGKMILIGSGGLLWHAFIQGITTELPEASMDVDPITDSDEIARFCYDSLIGSEFERMHGWHVNLMPESVINEMPRGWEERATKRDYGLLQVVVPNPNDLLAPKLKRGEPRDIRHREWAERIGLIRRAQ